jgi:tripartite-type tricarboxylate transporter receptor subunit TctC
MTIAALAPPDGYTILLASSSIVVNPNLYKSIPFDVEKDFIAVTKVGASPNSREVNSEFPAKTIKELITLMKSSPGKYSVASRGAGTTPSLAIEMLKQALGVSFVTVPFTGGGPMAQSLLGGFTPISCNAVSSTIALIKAGKVRALALTSKQHLETLPSVPTLDELDIKNQESETMAAYSLRPERHSPSLTRYRKKSLRSSTCPTPSSSCSKSPLYRTAIPRPISPLMLRKRSLSGSG